jgi:hypothetical protein
MLQSGEGEEGNRGTEADPAWHWEPRPPRPLVADLAVGTVTASKIAGGARGDIGKQSPTNRRSASARR